MDPDEIARRLEKIRDAVQQQLQMEEPATRDPDLPPEVPFDLRPGVGLIVGGEPHLGTTPQLERANKKVTISGPISLRSPVPVVGALLTLVRKLFRPLVQPVVDPYVSRQEEFNAEAVRHLNELGTRLETRMRHLEEALIDWSANPSGIENRLRRALEDYDAALRLRHSLLFGVLEDELLALQNLARDATDRRIDELRALFSERSEAVDRRFDEKDRAVVEALAEKDRAIAELAQSLQESLQRSLTSLNEELNARTRILNERFERAETATRRSRESFQEVRHDVAELLALRTVLKQAIEEVSAEDGGRSKPPVARTGEAKVAGKSGGTEPAAGGFAGAKRPAAEGSGTAPATAGDGGDPLWASLREWMTDQDYRAFQARFRGDPEEIGRRMARHVERFDGVEGPIADLGCGRGEFVELLVERGHQAIGVEINAADVEDCRERGLDAEVADLFEWLEARPEGSLGGIFLAQVIEHLPPPSWQRLVELAATRLEAGGRLVVETINPESLYAIVRAYVADPTHVRPVHPELLAFLARRAGFEPVDVEPQAPVPDDERPAGFPVEAHAGRPELQSLARDVRERLDRIDRLCCAPQEYTLHAVRPRR